jgi:hypothetical protein
MVPLRVGGSSTTTKKKLKGPVADVEVEEVVGTLTLIPPTVFHRDYLPPKKDGAPPINLPMNEKYPLPIELVLDGLSSDEDMLDKVSNLNFMDHNINDTQKIYELSKDQYLCTKAFLDIGEILVDPQEWALGLEKEGILKLFKIPHFRRSTKINVCVKVLLSGVHGGKLWLDPLVSIDTALIVHITGLGKAGEDPTLLFNKMGE